MRENSHSPELRARADRSSAKAAGAAAYNEGRQGESPGAGVPHKHGAGRGLSARALTLLTRRGCHLCEQACHAMQRVSAVTGVLWHEKDVDDDEELAYTYGDRVPVVLLDGTEHGFWRVDENRLVKDLTQRASSPATRTEN